MKSGALLRNGRSPASKRKLNEMPLSFAQRLVVRELTMVIKVFQCRFAMISASALISFLRCSGSRTSTLLPCDMISCTKS